MKPSRTLFMICLLLVGCGKAEVAEQAPAPAPAPAPDLQVDIRSEWKKLEDYLESGKLGTDYLVKAEEKSSDLINVEPGGDVRWEEEKVNEAGQTVNNFDWAKFPKAECDYANKTATIIFRYGYGSFWGGNKAIASNVYRLKFYFDNQWELDSVESYFDDKKVGGEIDESQFTRLTDGEKQQKLETFFEEVLSEL